MFSQSSSVRFGSVFGLFGARRATKRDRRSRALIPVVGMLEGRTLLTGVTYTVTTGLNNGTHLQGSLNQIAAQAESDYVEHKYTDTIVFAPGVTDDVLSQAVVLEPGETINGGGKVSVSLPTSPPGYSAFLIAGGNSSLMTTVEGIDGIDSPYGFTSQYATSSLLLLNDNTSDCGASSANDAAVVVGAGESCTINGGNYSSAAQFVVNCRSN